MAEGEDTSFAIVVTLIIGFKDRIGENQSGQPEIHTALIDVALPFVFIPFESDHQ